MLRQSLATQFLPLNWFPPQAFRGPWMKRDPLKKRGIIVHLESPDDELAVAPTRSDSVGIKVGASASLHRCRPDWQPKVIGS